MVDYEKLYFKLLNKVSDMIDALELIQKQSFEAFVEAEPSTEEVIKLIDSVKLVKIDDVKLK